MTAAPRNAHSEPLTFCRHQPRWPLIPAPPPPPARRPVGVLIVDDEPFLRALLEVELRQEGFAVWQAENSREALDLYRQHRDEIDLVLLDVHLPGLDGPQTFAILRRLNPELRCCFLSPNRSAYSEDELLEMGALAVLAKSYHLDGIAAVLGRLLERPQAAAAAKERARPRTCRWRGRDSSVLQDVLRMIGLKA
jgi:DNA-binding response OmpR family regulator